MTEPTEEDILLNEKAKQFSQLDPSNPLFLGIDKTNSFYWINGFKFEIQRGGFTLKKKYRKEFDEYDSIIASILDLDPSSETYASDRIKLVTKKDAKEESIIEQIIPEMLKLNGKQFPVEMFDEIEAGAWWDIAKDLYLFLRVKGSRVDRVASLTLSSTEKQADSGTTKT